MRDRDTGPHVSQVVAPMLAAFTLPTIAVIVMAQLPRWQNTILSIFLASTGLLLASFLLGTGRLFVDTPRQNEIRSVLAFAGIVVLTAGLALLVVAKTQFNLEIDVALLLLAGGVLIPIALNFQMWRTDPLRRDPTPLQDNALTEEE